VFFHPAFRLLRSLHFSKNQNFSKPFNSKSQPYLKNSWTPFSGLASTLPYQFTTLQSTPFRLQEWLLNWNLSLADAFSFVANKSVHDHFTRGRKDIHLDHCRTKKRQLTVMFQGPRIWNSLTIKLRESPSINIFMKKMKLSFFAVWLLQSV